MNKKITIKDVAAHAEVSPTTVSFVLNGTARHNRIRDCVIEKVQNSVDILNYSPNQETIGQRAGETRTDQAIEAIQEYPALEANNYLKSQIHAAIEQKGLYTEDEVVELLYRMATEVSFPEDDGRWWAV